MVRYHKSQHQRKHITTNRSSTRSGKVKREGTRNCWESYMEWITHKRFRTSDTSPIAFSGLVTLPISGRGVCGIWKRFWSSSSSFFLHCKPLISCKCQCTYFSVAPSVAIISPSFRYLYFCSPVPMTSSSCGFLGSLLTQTPESMTRTTINYFHKMILRIEQLKNDNLLVYI